MSESEQRLRMDARKKLRTILRSEQKIAELTAEVEVLQAELDAQVEHESKRLGVEVPPDAVLLDVLKCVSVRDEDGAWLWHGSFNNKNLGIVRYRFGGQFHDKSVVRFLAEAFGLVGSDWEGILYPTNGTDDVNPWHREHRSYPDGRSRGNARRYWRDET